MEDYQRKLHLNISYFNFLTIDWFCNRQPSISLPASNRLEIANINWYLHACIYRLSKNLWDSYLNEKNLGFVYKTCTLFVTEIAQNIFCIKSDVIKHKYCMVFYSFPSLFLLNFQSVGTNGKRKRVVFIPICLLWAYSGKRTKHPGTNTVYPIFLRVSENLRNKGKICNIFDLHQTLFAI